MSLLHPTEREVAQAIARAVTRRRQLARLRPEFLLCSQAVMEERITGHATPLQTVGRGWWIVGVVIDTTGPEPSDYSVLLLPGQSAQRDRQPRPPVTESAGHLSFSAEDDAPGLYGW